jgi:hypothetical protein
MTTTFSLSSLAPLTDDDYGRCFGDDELLKAEKSGILSL